MLQRICDRCGNIIEEGIGVKRDELPSCMCLVHLDIGPFQTGYQGDGNIKKICLGPTDTKQYELCKACKDELITWLTDANKKRNANA